LVIHAAIRRDERRHALRVEHVQRDHHAARIAILQGVRIPVEKLRQHPLLEELADRLIPVRLPQDGRKRGARRLVPDAICIEGDEPQRGFADVGTDERDAPEHGRIAQRRIDADLLVQLPGAGERFAHRDRQPRAAAHRAREGRSQP
jgi:hypothetical protein